jgi:hypothetical protein
METPANTQIYVSLRAAPEVNSITCPPDQLARGRCESYNSRPEAKVWEQ